jgi:hypothetical protein
MIIKKGCTCCFPRPAHFGFVSVVAGKRLTIGLRLLFDHRMIDSRFEQAMCQLTGAYECLGKWDEP